MRQALLAAEGHHHHTIFSSSSRGQFSCVLFCLQSRQKKNKTNSLQHHRSSKQVRGMAKQESQRGNKAEENYDRVDDDFPFSGCSSLPTGHRTVGVGERRGNDRAGVSENRSERYPYRPSIQWLNFQVDDHSRKSFGV